MHDLPMSEQVQIAVIGAAGVVVAAVVTALSIVAVAILNRTRQHAKAARESAARTEVNASIAREQLANDHDTNFREENDERHAETMRKLDKLGDRIVSMREVVDKLVVSDMSQWKHVRDLEDTLTPQQTKELRHGIARQATEGVREGDRRRDRRRASSSSYGAV